MKKIAYFICICFALFCSNNIFAQVTINQNGKNAPNGTPITGLAQKSLQSKKYTFATGETTAYLHLYFSDDGKNVRAFSDTGEDYGTALLIQTNVGIQARFDNAPLWKSVITIRPNGSDTDPYESIILMYGKDLNPANTIGTNILKRI